MSREEKIKFLLWAVTEIEGVELPSSHFDNFSDRELDIEVNWYEYLLGK